MDGSNVGTNNKLTSASADTSTDIIGIGLMLVEVGRFEINLMEKVCDNRNTFKNVLEQIVILLKPFEMSMAAQSANLS